jgi:hypothetical protein
LHRDYYYFVVAVATLDDMVHVADTADDLQDSHDFV